VTVLVTGVTGKTGRRVAESLVSRGVGVRAMVRVIERGKLATLGMGVELVLGDFDDRDSISEALDGCDDAFLVTQDSERQVEQEVSFAKLAASRGVNHIVKLSSSDAGQRPYAWSVAHAEIEEQIATLGISYSFIRPHFFMQNYLSLLERDSEGNVTLEAPANDGLIGAIDAYDIGACAAALLAGGIPTNDHSLLTGPENISMARVASAFSDAVGHSIEYVNLDPDSYREELDVLSPESAQDVADVYEEVRTGTMAVQTAEVERITGSRPRSIEQFAQANADLIRSAIERATTSSS